MKKIIARIMLLVMLISCVGTAAYSASEEEYIVTQQQFELLRAAGIVYGDSVDVINPTRAMTRADAAMYFSRMARISSAVKEATGYEALFYDTTSETSNYKYIKACVEEGLLNGYPDGTFRPNDTINSKDAAKVLLYAIGYRSYITVTNLDYVINQTGVMDGVPVTDNTNYAQFMQLAFNALHAPACVQTAFSGNDISYTLSDSVLAMQDKFGIIYGKGVVDGAAGTGLIMPDETMLPNMIAIDSVKYEYDGDSSALIGYDVVFYYRDNVPNKMGNRKIIWAGISDRNNILTVAGDDVESFSNSVFTYWKGESAKKVTLTPYTNVIYNGIAYPMYSDADFVPASGSVTFIDNDGDSQYEVVSIESFDYILVGNLDIVNEVIYDQNGVKKLDLGEADDYTITWTGEDYTFDRLLRGHFLKVKATRPDSGYYVVDIELSRGERTNALVERITKEKIYAGGTEYDRWSNLDADSIKALVTGSYVTLYFDGNMVVRVVGGGDGSIYGYIADMDAEGDFSTTVKALVVNASDATSAIYELNKKVLVVGTTLAASAVEAKLLTLANNLPAEFMKKGTVAQPIKFKLNKDGKISSIDTYVMDESKEDKETALRFATYEKVEYSGAHTGFSNATTHFGSYTAISPRLRIPDNPQEVDKYCVLTPTSIEGFPGYDIALCNLDKDIFVAEAVYFYLSDTDYESSKATYQTPMVIVTDKIVELNEAGDPVETVTCRGAAVDYTYSKPESEWAKFPAFDIGDLVRIETNAVGEISKVEVKFDVSAGMPEYDDTASKRIMKNETSSLGHIPLNYGYRAYWVTPLVIKENIMRVCMSSKDDALGFKDDFYADNLTYADAEIYKYKVENGIASLEPATINDIVTNAMNDENPSELLINVLSSKIRHIIIFE